MQLTINGEAREIAGEPSLLELTASLGLDLKHAAVELNGAIVPRSTYGEARLADGDRLELVSFIGGG